MNSYYSDKPINTSTEDLLDRSSFSKLLANTLINIHGSDTFTIGLFGKWGSGKTSIVNMALQEIENSTLKTDKEIIVVHFEPWHFSDPTELLSQFFIRLSNEFKGCKDKNSKAIGKAIAEYSNAFELAKFIPKYGAIISAIGKFFFKTLGKLLQKNTTERDVLSQKQEVIRLLKEQNKKILVIIDDIDRLNSNQIRQIFQLVSSVAKFPNTAYLLVFDKEVVVKALEKVQEGNGEDYLEKVIQMPIQIPDIKKEKLHSVLFERLNEILGDYSGLSFRQEHWQKIFAPCVSPFISNLRDINRLSNSLRFKLSTIAPEIDFADMIAISAIEIGVPNVYEWIKSHKSLLTSGEVSHEIGEKKKTQQEWLSFYKDIINKLLITASEEYRSKCDTNTVVIALAHLFPCFGKTIGEPYIAIDNDYFRRNNLIAHPEKFERYFYYDLNQVVLKKASIEAATLSLSCEEFMSFIISEDENDRGITALQEIRAMLEQVTSQRAKVLFNALIQVTYKLKTIERKSIVSVGAATYAEFLCLDLLDKIDASERYEYFSGIIGNADFETLSTLAVFINMIELGYGRLAANGSQHDYKKVITLEELLQIENVFKNKVKKVLEKTNLFTHTDWRMILHLLESFDSEYTNQYLVKALKKNENIISYLWDSVSLWTGTENSYEVRDNYSKYLSKDRILAAIKEEVNNKNIFNMRKETIDRAAAFYLNDIGLLEWDGHVSQEDVDKTVSEWKMYGIA